MLGNRTSRRTRWLGASIAAAAAAALSLVPSAGLAVVSFEGERLAPGADRPAVFTPASPDPQMARFVAERGGGIGRLKRFTPAGVDARGSRTVTVAVRVNPDEARAISVRSAIDAAQEQVSDSSPGIRIASTRYNLGLSRGYQNFAQSTPRPAVLSKQLSDAAIPNLADFRPSRGEAQEESRFAARIAVEQDRTPVAPSPAEAGANQTLDVAGSYRLTRNLDVTAGVRYSQERDRLAPARRSAEQDSQAVYIGTQFRF